MAPQLPHQSYTAWEVCVTILHVVAVLVTTVRLWLRYRTCRMWWDDYLVVVPFLLDIFYCVVLYAIPPAGSTLASISKASNYWLGVFPGFAVTWLSRICFLLLLTRLFPARHVYRRITVGLTVLVTLTFVILVAISVPPCDRIHIIPPPSRLGQKNCKLPERVTAKLIIGLTCDLLSDIVLVVWPLLMLYKVKLSRPKDRPLVMISLGCSVFTLLLIVAIIVFTWGPIVRDVSYFIVVKMLAHMLAAVSLIVCSIPIVSCAAYRAWQRARGVPLETIITMPDTACSAQDHRQECTTSPSSAQKVTSGGDTRPIYDNLTRVSMSFDLSDGWVSQPELHGPKQHRPLDG